MRELPTWLSVVLCLPTPWLITFTTLAIGALSYLGTSASSPLRQAALSGRKITFGSGALSLLATLACAPFYLGAVAVAFTFALTHFESARSNPWVFRVAAAYALTCTFVGSVFAVYRENRKFKRRANAA
jgi:hypothetical protein